MIELEQRSFLPPVIRAKHVDGQLVDLQIPIADCLDTFRSDPYCRTALGVQKNLVKKPIAKVQAFRSRPAVYTVSRLCKYSLYWGTSYEFASVASISVKCYKTAEGYEDILFIKLAFADPSFVKKCQHRYAHSEFLFSRFNFCEW